MREPPRRCLFCLSASNPFTRVEHPIPESLGNDDFWLLPGFVCDPCNQYFGAKIEKQILGSPPFCVERVSSVVRTKKGRLPKFEEKGLRLYSTGFWDRVVYVASPERAESMLNEGILWVDTPPHYGDLLARFLLKVGIEVLLFAQEVDPYAGVFDPARNCARYGRGAGSWNVAYGRYPRRGDLMLSRREDEIGPLETRQLYEYSLGRMANGDVVFFFAFQTHCYACSLTSPKLDEYLHVCDTREGGHVFGEKGATPVGSGD